MVSPFNDSCRIIWATTLTHSKSDSLFFLGVLTKLADRLILDSSREVSALWLATCYISRKNALQSQLSLSTQKTRCSTSTHRQKRRRWGSHRIFHSWVRQDERDTGSRLWVGRHHLQ